MFSCNLFPETLFYIQHKIPLILVKLQAKQTNNVRGPSHALNFVNPYVAGGATLLVASLRALIICDKECTAIKQNEINFRFFPDMLHDTAL